MKRVCISVIAGTLCCFALQTSAQETALKPLYERLLKGEDAKQAKKIQQKVDVLLASDDYAGAIASAEELLALRTKLQSTDHYETVNAKQDIAALRKIAALDADKRQDWRSAMLASSEARQLEATGQYAQALAIKQKTLEWCRNILGEDHPRTADAYNNVGSNLAAQGKAAEAQPLYQKALEINDRALGEDHPRTATSYNNLASNLKAQGKLDAAQLFSRKALEIRQRVLGEDHPDTATTYNNLASNLEDQGKAVEAQPLYQKALEINRRVLGEAHPTTASFYNNLAANLDAQGKTAEAQPLYQKALEINRQMFGEDNRATATSYNNVAMNLSDQGKAAEAQLLYQKALEINRRLLGEEHPTTAASYNNLASNLKFQGKSVAAQPLYQKALEIRRRILGEDHPDTAAIYNNLASNLNALEKTTEAQPLAQKALEIRRRVLGENHPATANSYTNVAANLVSQGKAAEAQPLLQKALEINRRVLGENHPATAQSYNNVAVNLNALGNATEAHLLSQRALEIRRRVLGENHSATAQSYNIVAINQLAQGKSAEAELMLRHAVFSYESSRLTAAAGLDRASLGRLNPHRILAVIQQTREPDSAWVELELSLARGLLDEQASEIQNLVPREEVAWTQERAHANDVQLQILALVTRAKLTNDEAARLDTLLKERRDAEKRLADMSVAASTREVASGESIRAALPTDAALLSWVDVASSSGDVQEHWACLVRRTGVPKWERLPGTGPDKRWSEDDTALPAKFRDSMAGSVASGEAESLAKQLRAQRIEPILQHLTGVKTLYVVPVDKMAGIPVEALTTEYTISYVPCGTFLARLKDLSKPRGETLLALGDPVYTEPDDKSKVATVLPPEGLLVTLVVPGGIGEQAGLKAGDVLLKYGDTELTKIDSLKEAIAANAAAKTIPITVWREDADKPLVNDIVPGKLGIVIDKDSAPVAIANRRKTDAMLLALRGGDWNDLPGTRVETSRIGKQFGTNATLLADSSASEQKLEALRLAGDLRKYRYLHFATHGEGNDEQAFESSLILAQDSLPKDPLPKAGEPFINGQLSASEVLEFWKLDAELVTLSACETAVGSQGGGDGPLGFAQAFLAAGSRAVCLSLWKVDDTATTLLMDRFYQNLLGKRSGLDKPLGKAAALAEAKNWLRNLSSDEALQLTAEMTKGVVRGKGQKALPVTTLPQPDDPAAAKTFKPFDHPKYWAAFILIGDPD